MLSYQSRGLHQLQISVLRAQDVSIYQGKYNVISKREEQVSVTIHGADMISEGDI